MAHNLNSINGRVSFFTVKEPAWHGLGKVLEECPNSEEAIKLAGLDFEVAKAPIYANIEAVTREGAKDGKIIIAERSEHDTSYSKAVIVEDKFATYRTDTNDTFGVVGSRYEVVQNRDAFKFFDEIVGEGEAIYETAGALLKGQIIFITAKLPSYIKVGKDDIEKYLLLTMSHDGSTSIQAMFTPIRVVCNNTLNAALQSSKSKVSIRHTKSAHENLKAAHKVLGITSKLSQELDTIFNNLAKTPISDQQAKNYFKLAFLTKDQLTALAKGEELSSRQKNILLDVEKYYNLGAGQREIQGSVWGAYNAITGYFQNVKKFNDLDSKMSTNLLGANYNTMQDALVLANDFSKGSYSFEDILKTVNI